MATDNDVTVITTGENVFESRIEDINGVKVYRIHPINIYALYRTKSKHTFERIIWNIIDTFNVHSYSLIRKIIIKENPDVVHIHHFKGLTFSFNAVKSLKKPLVYTAHNYFLACPKEDLFKDSTRKICNNPRLICRGYRAFHKITKKYAPDIVTTPTKFVRDKLRELGFFENSEVITIPLGIEINREKFQKDYREIDLLFVGRITEFKGIRILLKALEDIELPNLKLHVVGSGSLKFEKNNVKFYGYVSEVELKELYKKANILIIPSIWYEVFGLVILEGFNYGLAAIGSNIGGIPEVIENGHNGLLFKPGDASDLREKILTLVNNSKLMKRLSINARRSVKKYDIKKHVSKLYNVYERVIS